MSTDHEYIRWFENLTSKDVSIVGGKNASLGEMIRELKSEGVRVPDGFATTAAAYRLFIETNELEDKIRTLIQELENDKRSLAETGKRIRRLFRQSDFPAESADAVRNAYQTLCDRYGAEYADVAARSSATAEDLPDASFAGQQETFLNVTGADELINACKNCYASLFTDRAISYRAEKGFDHMKIALSVGVQKMVRSDKSGSGVMFSIDTETGFPRVMVINAAWGLGENVVQGSVTPDEYRIFKPLLRQNGCVPIIDKVLGEKEQKLIYTDESGRTTKNIKTLKHERRSFVLNDEAIMRLGAWGTVIESHYDSPMDIEWARDGESGELYIVQARPETVQSRKEADAIKHYALKEEGKTILTGLSIGQAVAAGKACRIKSPNEIEKFREGEILVTEMTDPDWAPIMKKAAGIVTDAGGRTCHAAIVSRELGIPAVVGAGDGTDVLNDGQEITISCIEGEKGYVYEGALEYTETEIDLKNIPDTRTRIMMNIASPAAAFRWWRLPCDGIGLARMEFIVNNEIKIHPMALVRFDDLEDAEAKRTIEQLTARYEDKSDYFVDHLSRGIAKIAASCYPAPVIVRMSDFKTNEYAELIGGSMFEPRESNPMLGFRGASRYYSDAIPFRVISPPHRGSLILSLTKSGLLFILPKVKFIVKSDHETQFFNKYP